MNTYYLTPSQTTSLHMPHLFYAPAAPLQAANQPMSKLALHQLAKNQ